MLKWLNLSLLVLVLDQLTKWVINNWLNLYESIALLPFLNLTLVYNRGAAFSFLAFAGGWQRWFFIVLSSLISVGLLIWLNRLKQDAKLEAVAIALILGGALGNVIDRFVHGYVIDFIDVYYQGHHWPAFNIADSAICIGAVLLIIDSFTTKAEHE